MKQIAAAFSIFTRIPVWKWIKIPQEAYSSVVVYWPLTGWFTGGTTALLLWLCARIMPTLPAIIVALTARTMLTGALHEDGLADFCDGFGGGTSKEKILTIMKDSHIGTYGVIGLILYYILFTSLVSGLPLDVAVLGIFAADAFAKATSSQLINFLPYARPEGAKNRITYAHMSPLQIIFAAISGILPLAALSYINIYMAASAIFPITLFALLVTYMRRKIGGYTGDCCGASCLLCEISMLIGITVIHTIL